jgi:hypothetical protein
MILGYRSTPVDGFEYAIEGFYKRYTNLFVGEWTAFPQFTTKLQPASGRSFGYEVRAEVRKNPFYGFMTYGYSNTAYAATAEAIALWFGTERLRYRPAHDRRHQINVLARLSVFGLNMGLRWQFGSGLPYTRPLAFDGFALVDDIHSGFDLEHFRRVVYERPFDSILPTYHRLDASIEKTWRLPRTEFSIQASTINTYDRRNIFYVDIFTLQRTDQLPFIPSLGLKIEFK